MSSAAVVTSDLSITRHHNLQKGVLKIVLKIKRSNSNNNNSNDSNNNNNNNNKTTTTNNNKYK